MDKLLEILGKHRCHLRRGSLRMADYLEQDFRSYIGDVKQALSINENRLVGAEMCKMVESQLDEMETNAAGIVNVLRLYGSGKSLKHRSKLLKCLML